MKYLMMFAIIFIIACNNIDKNTTSPALRFDGMYQSGMQTNSATGDKSYSYLKFYKDGTVINMSSTGTPEQVRSWFVKGHENVMQALYQQTGTQLRFTFDSNTAPVSYSGDIESDGRLQFHTTSNANAHEANVAYSFVAD